MNERFLNVLFLVFGTLVYHFMKISILIYIILITNGLFLKKKFQLFRCLEKQKKNFFPLFTYYKLKANSTELNFLRGPKMHLGVRLTSGRCQDQGVLFHLCFWECEATLNSDAGPTLPYSLNSSGHVTEIIFISWICQIWLRFFPLFCVVFV